MKDNIKIIQVMTFWFVIPSSDVIGCQDGGCERSFKTLVSYHISIRCHNLQDQDSKFNRRNCLRFRYNIKMDLMQSVKILIGFMWLRIGSNGGLC
jgi:hypothetical protein